MKNHQIWESKFHDEMVTLFDASIMLIDECKQAGYDAIIGVGIGGVTGMYMVLLLS